MQKAFELLPVRFDKLLWVGQAIDHAAFPHALPEARPGVGRALGIEREPPRVEVANRQRHPDRALQCPLVRIGEDVENRCHLVADGIAQILFELAAHVVLELDDQAVDDPQTQLDRLFGGPGFLPQVVKHVVDVPGDLLDLLERVAFDDQHQVVPQVGQ
ncbi:hypothetical protein A5641_28410 [Mycobacterium sp. 1554424.7]|nr:hypothetical protein A5641_28410 [Mycobacterium sp. 1554424.7]